MAHKTMIGGTFYEITGGRTMVGGTGYSITKGRTMAGGTLYDIPFAHGTRVGDLPVGTSVYLNESGSPGEYLIVHQGLPSSIYDSSCDGTWLLRKDIYEYRGWDSSNVNDYANSTIHRYLNSTFLALFDAKIQSAIKQVKIPYRAGSGYETTVTSGANGLSAKIFFLSASEVGFSHIFMPINEGAELSYFAGCADNAADSKRIANMDGSADYWWLRSPYCWSYSSDYSTNVLELNRDGDWTYYSCSYKDGVRPALILPPEALVNDDFLIAG